MRTGSPPVAQAQGRGPEKTPGRARATWLELAAVILLFAALSVAWTWPLAAVLGRVLPSDLGDPLLNTWILGWVTDRASHGFRDLWNAPIFFPYLNTLAYSEHLLGFLPITLPVHWLTHNPVTAYDVAFLVSYVLAGTGMYVLARSVCGRRDAALLAALAFAFSPYRSLQGPHLQTLMSGWMPIALWALHRYLGGLSLRMLAVLVAAFLLQALSNGYLLYYLPVALVVVALRDFPWRTRARWRALAGLVLAAALALAALAPVASVYYQVRREQGLVRSTAEMATYSAEPASYVRASNSLRLWGPVLGQPADTEATLFPGAVILVLAAMALVTWRRGYSRHTVTYALVAATAVVLSFGPQIVVGRRLITEHGPYAWLVAVVPGLDGLRVPARLGLVVILALAVLAAIGASRVLQRLRGWAGWATTAVVGVLILAEGFGGTLSLPAFSAHGRAANRTAYGWLERQPPGALLTLPIGHAGTSETKMGQQYRHAPPRSPTRQRVQRLPIAARQSNRRSGRRAVLHAGRRAGHTGRPAGDRRPLHPAERGRLPGRRPCHCHARRVLSDGGSVRPAGAAWQRVDVRPAGRAGVAPAAGLRYADACAALCISRRGIGGTGAPAACLRWANGVEMAVGTVPVWQRVDQPEVRPAAGHRPPPPRPWAAELCGIPARAGRGIIRGWGRIPRAVPRDRPEGFLAGPAAIPLVSSR